MKAPSTATGNAEKQQMNTTEDGDAIANCSKSPWDEQLIGVNTSTTDLGDTLKLSDVHSLQSLSSEVQL